ncbi:MAG: TylF/MycF/NovP-related O-methyltransferase [Nitrososphaerota archaeon]
MINVVLFTIERSYEDTELIELLECLGYGSLDRITVSEPDYLYTPVLNKIYEKVKTLPPDNIVLVVNGERAFPVHNEKRLLYKFRELGYEIVFSSDFVVSVSYLPARCYEVCNGFLYGHPAFNGFIGRAGSIVKFFEDYGIIFSKPTEKAKDVQACCVMAALNARDERIILDHLGCIFFPGIGSSLLPNLIEVEDNVFVDKVSCSVPSILNNRCYSELSMLPSPEESIYYVLDEIPLALTQKKKLNPFYHSKLDYEGRTMLSEEKASIISRIVNYLSSLHGDLVEVGCWKGGCSKIMRDNSQLGEVFAFDTFSGLPALGEEDNMQALGEGFYSDADYEDVKRYLGSERVHVIKGKFPDSKPRGFGKRKLKFAHIDVNLYEYTLKALKTLYPMMVPGGVIVLDDYKKDSCRGVEKAIDEFVKNKKLHTFHPYGIDQCIIIKNEKDKKL